MLSKNRRIAGWVLAGLIAALLLFSAYSKFMIPEMAVNFEKWGLGNWRIIIACGEIIAALLFLFPRTNIFGVLLPSALMGGAIVVHMSHGEPFIMQSVILVLVIRFIRNPFMQATLH